MNLVEKQQTKISVVVPVYNGRKHFSKCLDSILRQTYQDIEVILVDDGSDDGVEQDCDGYGSYPNIIVIHKKHEGLQAARIAGIEAASGEYIGFVDADDWIDSGMYEYLMDNMGDSDLVTSGIYKHDMSGNVECIWEDAIKPGKYVCDEAPFAENLFFSRYYDGKSGMVGAVLNNLVCKLFRADLAKRIFPLGNRGIHYGEDFLFLYHYLLCCQCVTVTNRIFYHYRMNGSSIIHQFDHGFLHDRNEIYTSLMDAIAHHPQKSRLKHQFQRRFIYELMYMSIDRFGMPEDVMFPRYAFPSLSDLKDQKIILFGAGKVGRDYYFTWQEDGLLSVVMWVDTFQADHKIHGYTIRHPSDMKDVVYDIVVCAVLKENTYSKISSQLKKMGVPENKILWRQPCDRYLSYYQKIGTECPNGTSRP